MNANPRELFKTGENITSDGSDERSNVPKSSCGAPLQHKETPMVHISLLAVVGFYTLFFYFVVSVQKPQPRTEHHVANLV